jgi:hypothetical protein
MSKKTFSASGAWTPLLMPLPGDVAAFFRKSLESFSEGYQSRSTVARWRANLKKGVLGQPDLV